MDLEAIMNLFLFQSIMGMFSGNQGGSTSVASDNTVLAVAPIAVPIQICKCGGDRPHHRQLPPGVPQDRRRTLDRRGAPNPGRRATDANGAYEAAGGVVAPSPVAAPIPPLRP